MFLYDSFLEEVSEILYSKQLKAMKMAMKNSMAEMIACI